MKSILFVFFSLLSLSASAASRLEAIQLDKMGGVRLLFNSKVDHDKIRIEYNDDIIQLTLDNVIVYPSKMMTVDNPWIRKIFAYQYTPKEVRCRFSVKGKASSYQNRFRLHAQGNVVSARLAPKTFVPEASVSTETQATANGSNAVKGEPSLSLPLAAEASRPAKTSKVVEATSSPLSVSIFPFFMKMGLVIIALLGMGYFLRSSKASQWLQLKQKNGKMIEVLSSHYLGPKKSVTLVKVAGRVFLLGVTDVSVQLVTEIHDLTDENLATNRDDGNTSFFTDVLNTEAAKPSAVGRPINSESQGMRSTIRNRMEGLKPL